MEVPLDGLRVSFFSQDWVLFIMEVGRADRVLCQINNRGLKITTVEDCATFPFSDLR